MKEYCIKPKGEDCDAKHCYSCNCSHIPLDDEGFVISWYCNVCQSKRNNEPIDVTDKKPKTIAEIQAWLKEMGQKARIRKESEEMQMRLDLGT